VLVMPVIAGNYQHVDQQGAGGGISLFIGNTTSTTSSNETDSKDNGQRLPAPARSDHEYLT